MACCGHKACAAVRPDKLPMAEWESRRDARTARTKASETTPPIGGTGRISRCAPLWVHVRRQKARPGYRVPALFQDGRPASLFIPEQLFERGHSTVNVSPRSVLGAVEHLRNVRAGQSCLHLEQYCYPLIGREAPQRLTQATGELMPDSRSIGSLVAPMSMGSLSRVPCSGWTGITNR